MGRDLNDVDGGRSEATDGTAGASVALRTVTLQQNPHIVGVRVVDSVIEVAATSAVLWGGPTDAERLGSGASLHEVTRRTWWLCGENRGS